MQHVKTRTIVLVGGILAIPLTTLLYLSAAVARLPVLPNDLLLWLGDVLPTLITTVTLDLTVAALLLLGFDVDASIGTAGQITAIVCFLLLSLVVTVAFATLMKWRSTWRGLTVGAGAGAIWGVTMTFIALSVHVVATHPIMLLLWLITLFGGWGLALGYVYEQLTRYQVSQLVQSEDSGVVETVTRRQFMGYLAMWVATCAAFTFTVDRLVAALKLRQHTVTMAVVSALDNPTSFPATLKARIFPTDPSFQFPEQQMVRYRPNAHPIGICFSGGGGRSAIASLGQMRGLLGLGLLDQIGAISAVSGGAWFSTIFAYAPTSISDDTLLGPILKPTEITLQNLAELDPHCFGATLVNLTTENLTRAKTNFMLGVTQSETQAFNRVYARVLNEFMLAPFGLDNTHKFFTLDLDAVARIRIHNPMLKHSDFQTMRPNRPYLIVGAVVAYPPDEAQDFHWFEFTPLYTGTPQLFPAAGVGGADIGGGYVESFAFDSLTPSRPDADNLVNVTTPNPIFHISDMMASTSAAPGAVLNELGAPEWFPRYNYWPVHEAGRYPSGAYSIIDASLLDNTGITSLLSRQFPVILAFVNSRQPLGAKHPSTFNGVDRQIARLFGIRDPEQKDTQIFPTEKFAPLAMGLQAAKANGNPPFFTDSYPIVQPNSFDIAPYPGNGEVTVVWFYNDLNVGWQRRLSPQVQVLLASTDPTNDMANFPNYKTYFQNQNRAGIPQLLQFTPQQINLLAHMWTYTVMEDAAATILALQKQFA